MSGDSWTSRVFGGFKKTSERLTENLAGIVGKTKLDDDQLDDLEDALILSDLGPRAAARIRDHLAAKRFEDGADEHGRRWRKRSPRSCGPSPCRSTSPPSRARR
jgi:fused signal recognition particle receptor